jgi:ribosome recycling factor
MSAETRENAEMSMEEAIETVKGRLSRIRTGKATPAMLEGIKVEYYGVLTPLNQLATVAVPEPRLLTVKPFDRGAIGEIEKAIQAGNLGFNPASANRPGKPPRRARLPCARCARRPTTP